MADFPIDFGRYQLVERLAMGGMAELYIATAPGEHGFKKRVVIKRLLPHLMVDETHTAMFIDEAKLTAKLVHPKIAQTFELGKVDDALFIAMEYVDGIDVLAVLREFATRSRRVEPQLAAWIAHEVLDALDYAHNVTDEAGRTLGIVHRDISPSNILLSTRGDVKLVDFGIARAIDPERAHKSKSGTLKGKYGYMSPEQVVELPLDGRSDVFSVGIVLAELLTGRRLFAAANELDVLLMVRDVKLTRLDKHGTEIEPGLQHIVRKALKKSLDERWSSAAAFRDGLAEWLFDHRHRITNRQVADVVAELHDATIERRRRSAAAAPAAPASASGPATPATAPARGLEHLAASPQPSGDEDGMPILLVEDDISMPVISVSYDDVDHKQPQRSEPQSPPPPPQPAAPSLPASSGSPPPPPPAKARTITPVAAMAKLAITERVSQRSTRSDLSRTQYSQPPSDVGGTVEVAHGNSISSAVGAVVSPEAGALHAEKFVGRPFEDLTDRPPQAPPKSRAVLSPEELARKRPPNPPTLADIAEDPDDTGDFSITSPLRVLFRLMIAQATGLLVVGVGGIKKEIYVRDGQPEYVSSNVASELFGNYLVSKGVLSDGELAMALAMMPHYGGKLGDTLVGLGLLKPLEVFRHLTRQVRSKIIDVCTWNKGGYAWYAGRENPREAFPLDFNAFEVLGAGALALSEDVIESWMAKHDDVIFRAARTRRVDPDRFEVNGLVDLFDSIDGKRTVSAHVAAFPTRSQQLKAGRLLCLLEACDLARPV